MVMSSLFVCSMFMFGVCVICMFVIGVFIFLTTLFVAPELKNVGALIVMIVILMVRPQGIFGRRERIG